MSLRSSSAASDGDPLPVLPRLEGEHRRQDLYQVLGERMRLRRKTRPWKLCGETTIYLYRGAESLAFCTRFSGHREKAEREPLKHFDEVQRYGWYDFVDGPPSNPGEAIDEANGKG